MKTKRLSLVLCAALAAVCACLGILGLNLRPVKAADEPKNISMTYGASARKDETKPGLTFKADIVEYNSANEYGMLILPVEFLDIYEFNEDYIAVLDTNNVTYSKKACTPYLTVDGSHRIALSLVDIHESNYTQEFIAIAYEKSGDVYTYADYSVNDNARSIAFIAQMALENESSTLTDAQKKALVEFSSLNSGKNTVTSKDYISYDKTENNLGDLTADVYGETEKFVPRSSVAAIKASTVGGETNVPMVTKVGYSNITSVSFDAKVTEDMLKDGTSRTERWGLDFITAQNEYSSAVTLNGVYIPAANLKLDVDVWYTYKYTISEGKLKVEYKKEGESAYTTLEENLTFKNPENAWYVDVELAPNKNLNVNKDVVYIDNFVIVADGQTYTDDFVGESTLFDGKNSKEALTCKAEGDSTLSFGAEVTKENMALVLNGKNNWAIASKKTYENITSITFDAKSVSELNKRVWIDFTTSSTPSGDKYGYSGGGNPSIHDAGKDAWYSYKLEISGGKINGYYALRGSGDWKEWNNYTDKNYTEGANYVYIVTESGIQNTTGDNPSRTANVASVYFDNFVITTTAGKESDNFDNSSSTLFKENVAGAISYAKVEDEDASSDGTSYSHDALLKNSKIIEVLNNGGYAYIVGRTFDARLAALPSSMLAVSAKLGYVIDGEKEFALLLNSDSEQLVEYILFTKNAIKLYSGSTLVKTIAVEASNVVDLTITKGGKIAIKLNDGSYESLGNISDISCFKLVALGGDGSVEFTSLSVKQYTPNGNIGVVEESDLASYDSANGNVGLTLNSDAEITKENMALAAIAYNSYSIISNKTYEGITSITFDAKYVSNSLASEDRRIWIDFTTSSTPSGDKYGYSGGGNPSIHDAGKDAWYSYKLEISEGKIKGYYALRGSDDWKEWNNYTDKNYTEGANYVYIVMQSGIQNDSYPSDNPNKIHAYFDNFVITTTSGEESDNFDNSSSTLFKENVVGAISYAKVEDKTLSISGELDYATLKTGSSVEVTKAYALDNLANSENILNGSIEYSGSKFAIVLGRSADKVEFILVENGKVKYCTYQDSLVEIKEIGDSNGTISLKLKKGGKLYIDLGNGLVQAGTVEDVCKLGISGSVAIKSLNLKTKVYNDGGETVNF